MQKQRFQLFSLRSLPEGVGIPPLTHLVLGTCAADRESSGLAGGFPCTEGSAVSSFTSCDLSAVDWVKVVGIEVTQNLVEDGEPW